MRARVGLWLALFSLLAVVLPAQEPLDTQVLFTLFDGRVIYEKGAKPSPAKSPN